MGVPIIIMGASGSGKSTSLKNFTDEIGIINVLGKPLPFKNKLPSFKTDDYSKVKQVLKGSKVNSMVIDDAGYLITNQFMKGHSSAGAGNAIFSFYNDIADKYWGLIQFVSNELDEKKIVYFFMHEDENESGGLKPKTIGKLLDEKVCIEGMVTVLLRCVCENNKHKFLTNGDGIQKSPDGMFETMEIDNDLKFVDAKIREYWNL